MTNPWIFDKRTGKIVRASQAEKSDLQDETSAIDLNASEPSEFLNLLREYNEKLREICKDYLSELGRKRGSALLSTFFLILFASPALSLFYIKVPELSSMVTYAVQGLSAILFLYTLFVLIEIAITPDISRYDALQIAEIVERLIRTASQYREHSDYFQGRQFEFDLRVSEAEATLRMYYSIFKSRNFFSYLARPIQVTWGS